MSKTAKMDKTTWETNPELLDTSFIVIRIGNIVP